MHKSSRIIIYLISILIAVMGALNILSAWLVRVPYRIQILRYYLPLEITHGGRILTVLSGLVLLFLSFGIYRHKQRAWLITCAVLFVSIIAHIIKGLDYEESIGSLLLLLFLAPMRKFFRAKSDIPSAIGGISVFLATMAAALVYGILGIYFFSRQLGFDFSVKRAAIETINRFFEFGPSGLIPITGRARWFLESINIVGALSLIYAFLNLLRPVIYRQAVTLAEHRRAGEILNKYGKSYMAIFTLSGDKSYFFNEEANVYIAYKNSGNITVALGDPIGQDDRIESAVSEFGRFCSDNDWYPVFYQACADYLDIYSKYGFKALKIGEEGIVDLKNFTLDGNKNRHKRYAINKFTKLGYVTRLYEPPLGQDLIGRLKIVSDEWLYSHRGEELAFSLGGFYQDYLKTTTIMTLENKNGEITAFVNIINKSAKNEASIDLMRHVKQIENGAMDFLFIELIKHFKKKYSAFSMGFSPLSGVGFSADATALEKAIRLVYTRFNRFYSFKGLRQFKEKFHPQWEPRYLIYPGGIILPKAAIAIINVHIKRGIWNYLNPFRGLGQTQKEHMFE